MVARDVQQSRNVRGIILQIAIERDDEAPSGVGEPCRECGGLTEVAREPDDANAGVARIDLDQPLKGAISAPIVHQNDFVRDGKCPHHTGQFLMERDDVGLLVPKRDDDRDFGEHV